MKSTRLYPLALVLCIAACAGCFAQARTRPCPQCEVWNQPQKPFRIFGNSYYVGTHGLSSVLITSPGGHVLIDGALPESASQIADHIRSLGFRLEDVRIIVNSHVHYDHAGGIAELQRLSGARVYASPWSAAALRQGTPMRGDPQAAILEPIAPIKRVDKLRDGQILTVGDLRVTAHFTPGHTPGGTSWTWKSCEGDVCRDLVYADSLTPVSAEGFSFLHSREFPHAIEAFEKSFKFLESTPCDILITTHPDISALWDRLAAREKSVTPDPLVNSAACRDLAQQSRDHLRERLEKERAASK